jgi:hypothetical protein
MDSNGDPEAPWLDQSGARDSEHRVAQSLDQMIICVYWHNNRSTE